MKAINYLVSLILGMSSANAGELVRYSFDEETLESGPDTFAVFQNSGGSVRLSSEFKLSGHQSVELRDKANDGDFPELQGYFPVRKKGTLFVHFAIMVATEKEDFNIALAGPQWFKFRPDGMAMWFISKKGEIYLRSSHGDKFIFKLKGFVWYVFDIEYRIDAGVFDLKVSDERGDSVATLTSEPNAIQMPGAAVDKFSFIGDHPAVGSIEKRDSSSVVYYVDDIVIRDDEAEEPKAFAAPGRRKLFIDAWYEAKKEMKSTVKCFMPEPLVDLGLTSESKENLRQSGFLDAIKKVVYQSKSLATRELDSFSGDQRQLLEASQKWMLGCKAVASKTFEEAQKNFDQAAQMAPRARIFRTSKLIPLAMLGKWEEFDRLSDELRAEWREDSTYLAFLGRLSLNRKELGMVSDLIRDKTRSEDLKSSHGRKLAELYFATLLWNDKFSEALSVSKDLAAALGENGIWAMYRGDAAFYMGDFQDAKSWYEKVRGGPWDTYLATLRLSDVHFKLGDLTKERQYREKIYGSLSK
jgi:hypothetical protein